MDLKDQEPKHYEVAKVEASETRAIGKGFEAMPLVRTFEKYFASLLLDPRQTQRFMMQAVGYLNVQPQLMRCDQVSFTIALMQIAELGLMPGPTAGHAYLVPFNLKSRRFPICTLIPGYKGLRHCAMRAVTPLGETAVEDIYASLIHRGDTWEEVRGTERKLVHVPARDGDQDDSTITHAYAVAKLRGSSSAVFVNLPKARIEFYRMKSPAGRKNEGPWRDFYGAMAMKTAFKRLYPWLPSSYEAERLLEIDARVEQRSFTRELEMDGAKFFEGVGPEKPEATEEVVEDVQQAEKPAQRRRKTAKKAKKAEKPLAKYTDDPSEPQPEPQEAPEEDSEPDEKDWLALEVKGLLRKAAESGVNMERYPPTDDLRELSLAQLQAIKAEVKAELAEGVAK